MREILASPAGTAVAVVMVLVLGFFAIRGVWQPPAQKEAPHFYIRLRAARRKGKKRL